MTGSKRLTKSQTNRQLTGVCGGLADYLGLDANLIRVLLVVGTVFSGGVLIIGYLAAALLIPES